MKKSITLVLAIVFSYACFAQGYYFEMKMSSSKQGQMGTMKAYAQGGNSRSEISVATPMGNMDVVTLSLKEKPGLIYMVNEKSKTYSEMDISKNEQWKDGSQDDYEITVLGKETVNGYKAIHVKVKRKDSKTEQEMWLSPDVVDFATFMKAKTKFTGHENLYKALEAKGAIGFPVRILASERGTEVQVDFVKAEKREIPVSTFTLDGYTKSTSPVTGSGNMQDMIQKMQNMTPEERKAFMEQMKQQYQQGH